MSEASPRLKLPYIQSSQAQKHITHNEALQRLDVDDVYALGAVPVLQWSGEAGKLAFWSETAWIFIQPQEGWRAWGKTEGKLYIYHGSHWVGVHDDLQNIEGIGIGTTYDTINKLAVASDATLLNHNGTNHQLKINKATITDTASLLYQTNYTAHAEMGLAGDNNFAIKTSADGNNWHKSLKIDL